MSETPILPPGFAARAAAQSAIPQVQSSLPQPTQIKQASEPSPAPVDAPDAQDSTMIDAPQEGSPSQNEIPPTNDSSLPSQPQATPIPPPAPAPTPIRLPDQSTPTAANSRATSIQPPISKTEISSPAPTLAIPHGAPVRQYLNTKVTGPVLEGMKILAREQPADPLRWLAGFLMERSREFGEDQG